MAGMRDYPYKFNDTVMLYPISWQETFTPVEEITEAGTDIVAVTRYGKLSVSASYKVSDTWLRTIKAFSTMDSFTLYRYDAVSEGYEQHTVRMRGLSISRVRYSEDIAVTNGIWEVSFNLEEF